MTDFQKKIYSEMDSNARVMLLMDKIAELTEYASIITDEDLVLLNKVVAQMEKNPVQKK